MPRHSLPEEKYRHTQIGYVTLVVSGSAGLVAYLFRSAVHGSSLWVALAVLLLVAIIFGSLTTEVTRDRFTFWFGPGLIRRSFALSDIGSCAPVVNPWYYGWGIHLTPHGWLYNVSGTQAVELSLRGGKKLRIGSDEPAELHRMILAMKGGASREAAGE